MSRGYSSKNDQPTVITATLSCYYNCCSEKIYEGTTWWLMLIRQRDSGFQYLKFERQLTTEDKDLKMEMRNNGNSPFGAQCIAL